MEVDAIVNAANSSLLGGGGVDGAIHRAAGPGLLEECRTLGGCPTGEARVTGGYRLPCRWVIHTVGPVWQGGTAGEPQLLAACYRNALALALEKGCETVAFPLISSGVYGYPKDKALRVAMDAVGEFLSQQEMTVYLVIFDRESFRTGRKLFEDIARFIDDRYVEEHSNDAQERRRQELFAAAPAPSAPAVKGRKKLLAHLRPNAAPLPPEPAQLAEQELSPTGGLSLEELVAQLDESFAQMLLRLIDRSGMTDAQCYKKANIDRKLFSKIRSNPHYRPSKATVLAFAIALELDLDQTKELLQKAGFALSHSNIADLIVEYFILNGNYNIMEINESLFAFDQNLLGS